MGVKHKHNVFSKQLVPISSLARFILSHRFHFSRFHLTSDVQTQQCPLPYTFPVISQWGSYLLVPQWHSCFPFCSAISVNFTHNEMYRYLHSGVGDPSWIGCKRETRKMLDGISPTHARFSLSIYCGTCWGLKWNSFFFVLLSSTIQWNNALPSALRISIA